MIDRLRSLDTSTRRVASLTAICGVSGVLHFAVPRQYEKIVPPGFGDPATMVKVSGVVELACAALVAMPSTRRLGGLLMAGLFVGVFPANIYAVKVVGPGRVARAGAVVRLPFQVPMIVSAVKVARGA